MYLLQTHNHIYYFITYSPISDISNRKSDKSNRKCDTLNRKRDRLRTENVILWTESVISWTENVIIIRDKYFQNSSRDFR